MTLSSALMAATLTLALALASYDANAARLHLVGDSTMSNKVSQAYPERGWGQLLPDFLQPELQLFNHAANGRSTRRFVSEGRWQALLDQLQPGDYVLIQFGHNDQKADDPSRYAAADSDYPDFLRQFVQDIRQHRAQPMLASSICRRHFIADGSLQRNLAEYAAATAMVAQQMEVTFVDLQQLSCDYLQTQGPAASQAYFIQVPADLYQKFPTGTEDNTHLSVQGAARVAQLFIRELRRQQHPLAAFIERELLP